VFHPTFPYSFTLDLYSKSPHTHTQSLYPTKRVIRCRFDHESNSGSVRTDPKNYGGKIICYELFQNRCHIEIENTKTASVYMNVCQYIYLPCHGPSFISLYSTPIICYNTKKDLKFRFMYASVHAHYDIACPLLLWRQQLLHLLRHPGDWLPSHNGAILVHLVSASSRCLEH